MPNTRAGAEGWAGGHSHSISPVSFLPLESNPGPAEFHLFPSRASAEQAAELDEENEGKKGQTKAELHRDCGGSAVGILPGNAQPAVGARFAPASRMLWGCFCCQEQVPGLRFGCRTQVVVGLTALSAQSHLLMVRDRSTPAPLLAHPCPQHQWFWF